ncbi:hypothetical protein BGX38DRAFT_1143012 [Terfezia claveryi]|nr:hypothetical protein BGX38DRAFT_1143012 [Terfezia claveryi]
MTEPDYDYKQLRKTILYIYKHLPTHTQYATQTSKSYIREHSKRLRSQGPIQIKRHYTTETEPEACGSGSTLTETSQANADRNSRFIGGNYGLKSKQPPGPGLSKYKIAQNLQISEKTLQNWISNENIIVTLQTNQNPATTGHKSQYRV